MLKTIIFVDNIVLYDENVSNPNIKRRNAENLDMYLQNDWISFRLTINLLIVIPKIKSF